MLQKILRAAAILGLAAGALALYLVRGGLQRFAISPYPVPSFLRVYQLE
jgi:hypothetical protein